MGFFVSYDTFADGTLSGNFRTSEQDIEIWRRFHAQDTQEQGHKVSSGFHETLMPCNHKL
jgi:hypothetical protein